MLDQLAYLNSQFGPAAVPQILFIAILLYLVLGLIQGTQADILLRGVLFLFIVLNLVGRVFQLTLIIWVLENALPGIILVIAIIFAPELRRLLERLGRTGGYIAHPFGQADTPTVERLVDDVTRAAGDLSRRSWGALMVLERKSGLEEIVETGTRLNATISPALLLTIFYPNSELHDLAVIIRSNSVLAAGCVLPMSEATDRDQHLGSRHRAGLGISEQSDAITVIVSEETGGISMAVDGKLARHLTEDQLRRRLRALFRTRATGRRTFREGLPAWLRRN
ncbi:MAG: diadenylate cyclase CdaA [Chloroflexota bacterium]|nr:diadenylate cyclase CdaA [Chloroflexota bacterium]MDP6758599.1 diadenylate cyclase CdaA [Chloroflexota bacterium]